MITTALCDDKRHSKCQGEGLVNGLLRPDHEPTAEGKKVWVTVECDCPCHSGNPDVEIPPEAVDAAILAIGGRSKIRPSVPDMIRAALPYLEL